MEQFVKWQTRKRLGEYLIIDEDALVSISLKGTVTLENVSVNPTFLNNALAPLTVRSGRVGMLTLQSDAFSLTSQPIKVRVKDVALVLELGLESSACDASSSTPDSGLSKSEALASWEAFVLTPKTEQTRFISKLITALDLEVQNFNIRIELNGASLGFWVGSFIVNNSTLDRKLLNVQNFSVYVDTKSARAGKGAEFAAAKRSLAKEGAIVLGPLSQKLEFAPYEPSIDLGWDTLNVCIAHSQLITLAMLWKMYNRKSADRARVRGASQQSEYIAAYSKMIISAQRSGVVPPGSGSVREQLSAVEKTTDLNTILDWRRKALRSVKKILAQDDEYLLKNTSKLFAVKVVIPVVAFQVYDHNRYFLQLKATQLSSEFSHDSVNFRATATFHGLDVSNVLPDGSDNFAVQVEAQEDARFILSSTFNRAYIDTHLEMAHCPIKLSPEFFDSFSCMLESLEIANDLLGRNFISMDGAASWDTPSENFRDKRLQFALSKSSLSFECEGLDKLEFYFDAIKLGKFLGSSSAIVDSLTGRMVLSGVPHPLQPEDCSFGLKYALSPDMASMDATPLLIILSSTSLNLLSKLATTYSKGVEYFSDKLIAQSLPEGDSYRLTEFTCPRISFAVVEDSAASGLVLNLQSPQYISHGSSKVYSNFTVESVSLVEQASGSLFDPPGLGFIIAEGRRANKPSVKPGFITRPPSFESPSSSNAGFISVEHSGDLTSIQLGTIDVFLQPTKASSFMGFFSNIRLTSVYPTYGSNVSLGLEEKYFTYSMSELRVSLYNDTFLPTDQAEFVAQIALTGIFANSTSKAGSIATAVLALENISVTNGKMETEGLDHRVVLKPVSPPNDDALWDPHATRFTWEPLDNRQRVQDHVMFITASMHNNTLSWRVAPMEVLIVSRLWTAVMVHIQACNLDRVISALRSRLSSAGEEASHAEPETAMSLNGVVSSPLIHIPMQEGVDLKNLQIEGKHIKFSGSCPDYTITFFQFTIGFGNDVYGVFRLADVPTLTLSTFRDNKRDIFLFSARVPSANLSIPRTPFPGLLRLVLNNFYLPCSDEQSESSFQKLLEIQPTLEGGLTSFDFMISHPSDPEATFKELLDPFLEISNLSPSISFESELVLKLFSITNQSEVSFSATTAGNFEDESKGIILLKELTGYFIDSGSRDRHVMLEPNQVEILFGGSETMEEPSSVFLAFQVLMEHLKVNLSLSSLEHLLQVGSTWIKLYNLVDSANRLIVADTLDRPRELLGEQAHVLQQLTRLTHGSSTKSVPMFNKPSFYGQARMSFLGLDVNLFRDHGFSGDPLLRGFVLKSSTDITLGSSMSISAQIRCGLVVFNSEYSCWEPLMEECGISLAISTGMSKHVNVKFRDPVTLNASNHFLIALADTRDLVRTKMSIPKGGQWVLRNLTNVNVNLRDVKGVSYGWAGPLRNHTLPRDSPTTLVMGLDGAWDTIELKNLDVGMYTLHSSLVSSHLSLDRFLRPVVEVGVTDNVRTITVHSGRKIHNLSGVDVEIFWGFPETLAHGKEVYLPLSCGTGEQSVGMSISIIGYLKSSFEPAADGSRFRCCTETSGSNDVILVLQKSNRGNSLELRAAFEVANRSTMDFVVECQGVDQTSIIDVEAGKSQFFYHINPLKAAFMRIRSPNDAHWSDSLRIDRPFETGTALTFGSKKQPSYINCDISLNSGTPRVFLYSSLWVYNLLPSPSLPLQIAFNKRHPVAVPSEPAPLEQVEEELQAQKKQYDESTRFDTFASRTRLRGPATQDHKPFFWQFLDSEAAKLSFLEPTQTVEAQVIAERRRPVAFGFDSSASHEFLYVQADGCSDWSEKIPLAAATKFAPIDLCTKTHVYELNVSVTAAPRPYGRTKAVSFLPRFVFENLMENSCLSIQQYGDSNNEMESIKCGESFNFLKWHRDSPRLIRVTSKGYQYSHAFSLATLSEFNLKLRSRTPESPALLLRCAIASAGDHVRIMFSRMDKVFAPVIVDNRLAVDSVYIRQRNLLSWDTIKPVSKTPFHLDDPFLSVDSDILQLKLVRDGVEIINEVNVRTVGQSFERLQTFNLDSSPVYVNACTFGVTRVLVFSEVDTLSTPVVRSPDLILGDISRLISAKKRVNDLEATCIEDSNIESPEKEDITIVLNVVQAQALAASNFEKLRPYCEVSFMGKSQKCPAILGTLDPQWNHKFEFKLPRSQCVEQSPLCFKFSVKAKGILMNQTLGHSTVCVDMKRLHTEVEWEDWIRLDGQPCSSNGRIQVITSVYSNENGPAVLELRRLKTESRLLDDLIAYSESSLELSRSIQRLQRSSPEATVSGPRMSQVIVKIESIAFNHYATELDNIVTVVTLQQSNSAVQFISRILKPRPLDPTLYVDECTPCIFSLAVPGSSAVVKVDVFNSKWIENAPVPNLVHLASIDVPISIAATRKSVSKTFRTGEVRLLLQTNENAIEACKSVSFELPKVTISCIDMIGRLQAREISALSLEDIHAAIKTGVNETQFGISVRTVQFDNQLPSCVFQNVIFPLSNGTPSLVLNGALLSAASSGVSKLTVVPRLSISMQNMCVQLEQSFINEMLQFLSLSNPSTAYSSSILQPVFSVQTLSSTTSLERNFTIQELSLAPSTFITTYTRDTTLYNADQGNSLLQTLISSVAQLDQVSLSFDALTIYDATGSAKHILDPLVLHYRSQFYRNLFRVVGSIDILGDPLQLVEGLGTGIRDFVQQPYQGLLQSPGEFGKGLVRGSSSLVSSVLTTSSTSLTKIGKSLGITCGSQYNALTVRSVNRLRAPYIGNALHSGILLEYDSIGSNSFAMLGDKADANELIIESKAFSVTGGRACITATSRRVTVYMESSSGVRGELQDVRFEDLVLSLTTGGIVLTPTIVITGLESPAAVMEWLEVTIAKARKYTGSKTTASKTYELALSAIAGLDSARVILVARGMAAVVVGVHNTLAYMRRGATHGSWRIEKSGLGTAGISIEGKDVVCGTLRVDCASRDEATRVCEALRRAIR